MVRNQDLTTEETPANAVDGVGKGHGPAKEPELVVVGNGGRGLQAVHLGSHPLLQSPAVVSGRRKKVTVVVDIQGGGIDWAVVFGVVGVGGVAGHDQTAGGHGMAKEGKQQEESPRVLLVPCY